jgi:hypothetical protein
MCLVFRQISVFDLSAVRGLFFGLSVSQDAVKELFGGKKWLR